MKRFIQVLFTVIVILGMFMPGWAGGARDVQAAVSQPGAWTQVRANAAYPATPWTGMTYTVPAGSNRLLVVAIASTRTTAGSQTVTALYGGQAMTLAAGDASGSTPNHTYLYYLNEVGIAAAVGTTVAVTISGGTSLYSWVHAATFAGVDQTTPFTSARNFNSGNIANSTVGPFNPTLTIAAGDQAVQVVNLARSTTTSNSVREISTWATGWGTAGIANSYNSAQPTAQMYIRNRNLLTAASDGSQHTADSNNTYDSMTAMSIKPLPVNLTPTVNAGSDQLAALEDLPANLDGTVTDDAFPGYPLITTWTKTSGPGTATFGDASAVDTTVTFDTVGVYVLQLTASDTQYSVSDEVTITYQLNTAPVVDAEPEDQSITGGGTANLTGAITDDGLPKIFNTLNSTWSLVSGPGTCTIGTPTHSEANDGASTHNTSISACTMLGDYTFRLTADDGTVLTGSDDVVVHVTPVVTATANGASYALIIDPTNFVSLSGTVLPAGATTWTVSIGPGSVTFGDASQVTTTATFTESGRYYLRLAADGFPAVFDEVVVDYVITPTTYEPPVQTYYMTLPEDDALTILDAINSAAITPIINYASIAVGSSGTIVYYDQWEDGYVSDYTTMTAAEVYSDPTNLAGVQVWGNGNCADGYPPNKSGVNAPGTCTAAWDTLVAGDVIILNDSVDVPNLADPIDYDARDKISATASISMAHATWATTSSTLNAFGHEMYATSEWGLEYEAPIGTDTPNAGSMFTFSGLSIMASNNDTSVYIDTNGDGTDDISLTGATALNEGGSYLLTGVQDGAFVHADKPIQVLLVTGEIDSSYASRDMNLLPVSTFSSSYWNPVGVLITSSTTRVTRLFLYNPSNTNTIYVRCEGGASTTTQSVTPNNSVYYDLTNNQAANCYAVTGPADPTPTTDTFFGIGTVDFDNTAYDWSFTLYPDSFLSTEALVGLGLGRDPLSGTDDNGSPLWATSACSTGGTYLYVDWNNDGFADKVDFNGDGDVADTNVNGFNETTSDLGFLVNRLVSVRLFNPADDALGYDQTGAHIWSRTAAGVNYGGTPGCNISLAWGEDPNSIAAGEPGLDVGTTVPPLRGVEGSKTLVLAVDNDGDGQISPGDVATYNITIRNSGMTTLNNVHLFDEIPEHTAYVAATTEWKLTVAGTWTAIDDDLSGTPFPLDVTGGVNLGSLEPGKRIFARFNITLDEITAESFYESLLNCEVTLTEIDNFTRCATTHIAVADWGDLPDVYKTTASQNGPRHIFFPGLKLGAHIDFEPQGQPTAPARGDDLNQTTAPFGDDEDGVVNSALGSEWAANNGELRITVGGGTLPGCLNGWMDINQDGDFADAGEQIFNNTPVVQGEQFFSVNPGPLLNAVGTQYYFRFRLTYRDIAGGCTAPVLPTGVQIGGEVEDYRFDLGGTSAVDMTSFSAAEENGAIVLHWITQDEKNNLGFNLYRANAEGGERLQLNEAMIETLTPPGSNFGAEYDFADTSAEPGVTYYYWLEAVDISENSEFYGPVEAQLVADANLGINFSAIGVKNVVLLNWETINETGVTGFNLYHATALDGKQTKLNRKLILSAVAAGSVDDAMYSFIDRVLLTANKTHFYWLEVVYADGSSSLQGPFQAKALK